ncbi:MAG: hypothetical protein K2K77_03335, partial [Duncaniella sp.]|nr:hypothetical protein [Duncaniella sp.]
MLTRIFICLAVVAACLTASCTGLGNDDRTVAGTDTFETSDLSLFELRHRVRNVTTTTYYNVIPGPDSIAIDTMPENRLTTVIYFDTLGRYVTRRDERIRRDSLGRIIRWEDHRPNLRRLHGGFLKDTLSYRHVSPNVV